MADCAERQRDEMAALAAIYGEEFELHDAAPGEMASCALRSAENTATLYMRLPHSYPVSAPEIDCTDASLLERLRSVVVSDGNECLMQICGEFHDALSDAAAQAEAAAAAPAPSDDREECILKIDHMNDADGYRKILRNWARALALSGRVLYANSGKRVHGVYVVLHGAPSVSAYSSSSKPSSGGRSASGRRARTVDCRSLHGRPLRSTSTVSVRSRCKKPPTLDGAPCSTT